MTELGFKFRSTCLQELRTSSFSQELSSLLRQSHVMPLPAFNQLQEIRTEKKLTPSFTQPFIINSTNIYWAHTLYQTQLKIQCWAEQISSDQRNAGKYWKLALQRWRETWFVPFANFCGVNTSPTTGFKLTTYEMACKISENLTIGFCEQLWPSSAHHCGAGPQCLPPSGGCCNTE